MADSTVAYVVKGYPRLSELFIASEIHRLEQLGLRLRLFVLKPADEERHHPVVDRIEVRPEHLPGTTSLSDASLLAWLARNAGPFLPALARTARRHPLRLLRTVGFVAAESWRGRKGWRLRKIYTKELLLAVHIADALSASPEVGHLHGHFAHGATTVTWLVARLTGLPFSFTGHAKDIYRESLNPGGLLARKMRAARFVVTCTDANRRHLEAIAPGAPVHVVYHGLNADLAPLVAACGPHERPGSLRILSVGRLVRKKGMDILVEAAAELVERGVQLELLIAGEEGDHADEVRKLVADRGLGAMVTFLGPLGQDELFARYRSATVFALACRVTDDGDRDGIPNVLMEAMAAGLPVVSTAVSGIPELVVDGENGLLVPPESASSLADAIARVAEDAALAASLSEAGRRTIATDFDGERLAHRLAGLLGGPT